MAAGERSGGSDLRLAQRRSPLVLLLPLLPLLLPARPALGNDGGASGSCRCEKYRNEPPLVKRFPDRLVSWERCRKFIRFSFPKNPVCGLDDAPWVLRLISRMGDKRKGSAKVSSPERSWQPSPTSHAPLQPLSSVRSTRVVPMETLPSQRLPALTHTTAAPALESVRSIVLPRNGKGSAKVSSSERSWQPSPTSRAPLQPLSSMGSTPVVPMETLPSQQVPRETLPSQRLPALTHTTATPALESVRSIVLPRNADAVAEVSPTRFGQEEGVPGWHQTTVLSALGIVLLLLVIVGLLCWWRRRPRRGFQAALTSEQQVWMLQQRPGGGPTCSPRADAASGSGWGG